jgi:proline racemase
VKETTVQWERSIQPALVHCQGEIGKPRHARALAEAGIELKALVARQIAVRHPEIAGLDEIAYVVFRGREADGAVGTCTTLKPGRVDRSPCGTGSSTNLATLHAHGEIKVGESQRSRSTSAASSCLS